jgi:RNA polymerase sigma-32 factor
MQNYVLHNWSIVRGGQARRRRRFFNLRRLRAKLAQGGNSRTGTEVFSQFAEVLGVSRSDVEVMDARLSGPDVSLNAPVGDSESAVAMERMAMLIDDKPRPDEVVGLALDTDRRVAWLNEALTALSERERRILRERRLADEAATLEVLGDRLGISKERSARSRAGP